MGPTATRKEAKAMLNEVLHEFTRGMQMAENEERRMHRNKVYLQLIMM